MFFLHSIVKYYRNARIYEKNHHYLRIFLVMDHFNNISHFLFNVVGSKLFRIRNTSSVFYCCWIRNEGIVEKLLNFYLSSISGYIYFKLVILLSRFKSSTLEHFTKRNQKMLYFVDDAYKAIENCRKFYVSSLNN